MSAAIVNVSNILLGNLNPNLLAPHQSKFAAARSNPLTSENPEIPRKAAQPAAAFENALKTNVSPQKPAKPLTKLAPETPLPVFNIAAQADLPQVILKKALTNVPPTVPPANPNAAAPATLATIPKPAPVNTETGRPSPPPPAQDSAAARIPTEIGPQDTAPAPDKPQVAGLPDSEPDTPSPQPLTPPKTAAAPEPESPVSAPEDKSASEPDAFAAKPVTPETRSPASHLQIRIPLPENIKTASITQNQPQATQNAAPAPKTATSTLNSVPAAKPAEAPGTKVEPPSKPQAPSQATPNPDNKPATDPAVEKAVITQIRTASDPKKPQDVQQPKADSALDPARAQQILAAAENQRPLEHPLPAQTRPVPLPSADTQNIARQLNESVTATIREGKNEVSVRLNPPELGRVLIKFEQADDGITARIEVARPQTRIEIEHALPDVLRGLASAGVQFKRLEVNLAQNADPQQYRHQSPADQQNQWTHHHDSQSFFSQHQTRTPHSRWFTDAPAPHLSEGSHPQPFSGNSLNMLM